MAKLTRITAKVFGETADATLSDPEIGQFGSAKAGTYNGTADVATIQGLSAWSNGWIDAVTPTQQFPPLPEMTGVHKVMSYQEAYLLQQGIPEWDSATTYYTNGFCSKGGKIYKSLSDDNLNNDPASDTVNWLDFTSNYADKDLSNVTNTSGFRKLTEIYSNGASWYKVYNEYDTSTGTYIGKWCEQGGIYDNGSNAQSGVGNITLLKQYKDTNYCFQFTPNRDGSGQCAGVVGTAGKTSGSIDLVFYGNSANDVTRYLMWQAEGYIS